MKHRAKGVETQGEDCALLRFRGSLHKVSKFPLLFLETIR